MLTNALHSELHYWFEEGTLDYGPFKLVRNRDSSVNDIKYHAAYSLQLSACAGFVHDKSKKWFKAKVEDNTIRVDHPSADWTFYQKDNFGTVGGKKKKKKGKAEERILSWNTGHDGLDAAWESASKAVKAAPQRHMHTSVFHFGEHEVLMNVFNDSRAHKITPIIRHKANVVQLKGKDGNGEEQSVTAKSFQYNIFWNVAAEDKTQEKLEDGSDSEEDVQIDGLAQELVKLMVAAGTGMDEDSDADGE